MKSPQTIANLFNQGKLVIFPTDTVWGVGCGLDQPTAIDRLYSLKHRSLAQPTAVLVANFDQAQCLGQFSPQVKSVAEKVWPGPVTLIVPATDQVSQVVLGGGTKVGLRIPNHHWLLAVLEETPSGIVATSANFAGRPAPLEKTLIESAFRQRADFIVEGVKAGGELASTVVDTTTQPATILREGTISTQKIKQLFDR